MIGLKASTSGTFSETQKDNKGERGPIVVSFRSEESDVSVLVSSPA